MTPYPRPVELFLELAPLEATSGREKPVAQYIERFVNNLGLECWEDQAHQAEGGNTGNIIVPFRSGGDRVLVAHMDTALSTHGVQIRVNNGALTSDGTTILGADNRAGVAILLTCLERAVQRPDETRDFTAAFTICEETTLSGSRNLDPEPQIKAGFVFDSSQPPGTFIQSTYGAMVYTATIYGRAAHSAVNPEQGINSITIASRAIQRLPQGRINGKTVVNIGRIAGGTGTNVVPEKTAVEGEVRAGSQLQVLKMVHRIRHEFQRAAQDGGAELVWQEDWNFKPYRLSTRDPVVRQAQQAIRSAGLIPVPATSAGGSDANSLNSKRIPTINFGIGARNPHAVTETILVQDLLNSTEIGWQLVSRDSN